MGYSNAEMESTNKNFYLSTERETLLEDVMNYFQGKKIKIDLVDKSKKKKRLNFKEDIFDEDIFDEDIFDNEPEEIEGDEFFNINS